MLPGRESRFPIRRSVIRGRPMHPPESSPAEPARGTQSPRPSPGATRSQIPRALYLVALAFVLITLIGALLPFAGDLLDGLGRLDEEPGQTYTRRESERRAPPPAEGESPMTKAVVQPPPAPPAADQPAGGELHISIGQAFRPVGFVVQARSHSLPLSNRPDRLYKRLPTLLGREQSYGAIELAGGQVYRFMLDMVESGYLFYLDRNRNGDLTDDGAPLPNTGDGKFANRVSFPLARVTGIPQLSGEYDLWIFGNGQSWRDNSLRYYAMTQLSGQLRLGGELFTAYLADNHVLDADFTNDGLGIDLNGDGKIESIEYLPPGGQIRVADQTYRVRITR